MDFYLLKWSGTVDTNAHREAVEKSDEEYQKIVNDWNPGFWDEISKKKIIPLRIYNSNQLGLFHAKLPDGVYTSKEKANEISGAKN